MELATAVRAGDAAAVNEALARGDDPQQWLDEDTTLIEHAAWKGREAIVRALLDAGALPGTALIDAAASGHEGVVSALLEAGADPSAAEEGIRPPLIGALLGGHLAVLRQLVTAGARLDACFDDRPALIHAIAERRADMLEALIAAGAPLELAERDQGFTPLLAACAWGEKAAAERLLAAGASLRARSASGDGPLDLAYGRGDRPTITWLESLGETRRMIVDAAFRERYRSRPKVDGALAVTTGMEAYVARIVAWQAAHPGDALSPAPPASFADIEAAQTRTGWKWPAGLCSLLLAADGRVQLGEYETLSAKRIADRWDGLRKLFEDGTFDTASPHQPAPGRVHPVWWHPGLVPFARDGGGNLVCVDLDPGPEGVVGQIVQWEVHGGPVVHPARSIREFFQIYCAKLEALKSWGELERAGLSELTRG